MGIIILMIIITAICITPVIIVASERNKRKKERNLKNEYYRIQVEKEKNATDTKETNYINECWNEIEKKDTKTYQQVKNEWKEVQKHPSIYQQIYWGARRPKQRVDKIVHYKKKRHILNKILVTLGILSEIAIILITLMLMGETKNDTERALEFFFMLLSIIKIVLIFKGRKKTEKIILD